LSAAVSHHGPGEGGDFGGPQSGLYANLTESESRGGCRVRLM
jgi:hypothetical protein